WREAHDEYVRLTEQLKTEVAEKQRTTGRQRDPAVKARQEADQQARAEQIEQLQDEIELLKVQVRVKQAHMEGVRVALDAAMRKYEMVSASGEATPAAQIADARTAVVIQQTQLRVKEAELQEPLVRLKQAERRLARLKGQAAPTVAPARQAPEQRLMELE